MSQAIAQSATQLTVSGQGEDNFDFAASVKRSAERTAKGATRESQMLKFNVLISLVCADYRSHFASLYGKTDRLPTAIFNKVEAAVTEYINSMLNRVNATNVISFRRAFHHNSRDYEVTERVTNLGENKLTLKEQLLGITIMITAAEKRLKDLEAKPTPDYDREKQILGEIKTQETQAASQ